MKTNEELNHITSEVIKLLQLKNYQEVLKFEKEFDMDILEDTKLLCLFGTNRLALDQLNLAENYLLKSIEIDNKLVHALTNLGILYERQDKNEDALKFHKMCIKINPNHYDGQYNIGSFYAKQENFKDAVKHYKIALNFNKNIILLKNLTLAYMSLDDDKNALKFNDMAIELDENDIELLNRKANILIKLKKFEEAIDIFKKLIKSNSSLPELYFNLGVAYKGLDETEKEISCYKNALKIDPKYPEANHNLGLYLLRDKNFKEGWEKYEYRMDPKLSDPIKKPNTTLPIWSVNDTDSKLFVWPEQGVGDCIFFASLLPELKSHCYSLTCAVDKRLVSIFQRSMPNIKFIPSDAEVFSNQFDHQLAIGSIPKFFRNNLKDFEKTPISYLKADLKKSLELEKEIKNTGKFTIGISWKSKSSVEKRKTIDLVNLINSLKIPAKFVNLQYGEVDQEIKEVKEKTGVDIIKCKSLDIYNDLDGLASLMCACDVVVSIPNVNQTIASALGIPTFLLVSNNPTFRWTTDGIDNIWHPNTKVFRQTPEGDWQRPINELSQVIINLIMQLYQKQA